jgi:hypothetical protein
MDRTVKRPDGERRIIGTTDTARKVELARGVAST